MTYTPAALGSTIAGIGFYPTGYISGNWYWANYSTGTGSGTLAQNAFRAFPFVITAPVTLTNIGVEMITAGDASGVMRTGIWRHDPTTGKPGLLAVEAATLSVGSGNAGSVATGGVGGNYAIPVNAGSGIALMPGVWWIGCVAQNTATAPSFRVVVAQPSQLPLGTSQPLGTSNHQSVSATVTGALGDLSNPAIGTFANSPRICFKVA